jgi:nucleoside-diphosphate-sugar epimerase
MTSPVIDSRGDLIDRLQRIAPPGQTELDPRTVQRLAAVTADLVHHHGDRALQAFTRFVAISRRGLPPFEQATLDQLEGETILVTGGSGYIGTALLEELKKLNPARLVSVARGETVPVRRVQGVDYLKADVRNANALDRLLADVRPTVVFHLAAQRDPSLAEQEEARTISTNVLGTKQMLTAARAGGVRLFIYASTGKALRFHSNDIYAASKKAGEWLVTDAAAEGEMACGIVRFTHVTNNSVIRRNLLRWAEQKTPARIHHPHVSFYLQSALESSQLLVAAALEANGGTTYVHAIRDLGEPVDLLDLALGMGIALDRPLPIYLCGFEAGYESQSHPALYDPRYSLECSPLLNGLEAASASPSQVNPALDRVEIDFVERGQAERLEILELCCLNSNPEELRSALGSLSWELLAARLPRLSPTARRRALARTAEVAHQFDLSEEHIQTTEAIAASLPERNEESKIARLLPDDVREKAF